MLDVKAGDEAVVRASAAPLSDATGQFSVPDGAEPGTGGRPGAGGVSASVSRAGGLRAEREVHDLAVPDRDEFGVEFGARQPLPANWKISLDAPVTVDAEDGDEKALDVAEKHPNIEQHLVEEAREKMIRHAIEKLPEKQRAAVLLHKYQELDYARDCEDFEMFGERAEIAAVPGIRNAASGTSPARGACKGRAVEQG